MLICLSNRLNVTVTISGCLMLFLFSGLISARDYKKLDADYTINGGYEADWEVKKAKHICIYGSRVLPHWSCTSHLIPR